MNPPHSLSSQAFGMLICPTADFQKSCQSVATKIFRFIRSQNRVYGSRHPAPRQRGVSRSSRNVARVAMDALASTDE
jgi:hypothetical protein